MPMIRWLTIVIGVLALAAVLLALVLPRFYSDQASEVVQRMTTFAEQLQNGYVYDAYDSTATRLHQISFVGFEKSLENYGLIGQASVEWVDSQVSGTEATARGRVELDAGQRDLITAKLVRELGQWRIYSLVSEKAGNLVRESLSGSPGQAAEEVAPDSRLPGSGELQRLVNDTLMHFNEALQIEYFGPFYQQISQAWQQQTNPAELLSAFRIFIEREISFAELRGSNAVFTVDPYTNDYGILHTEGYYDQVQRRVFFEMKFVEERGDWRLFGVNINISRTGSG